MFKILTYTSMIVPTPRLASTSNCPMPEFESISTFAGIEIVYSAAQNPVKRISSVTTNESPTTTLVPSLYHP